MKFKWSVGIGVICKCWAHRSRFECKAKDVLELSIQFETELRNLIERQVSAPGDQVVAVADLIAGGGRQLPTHRQCVG